MIDLRLSKNYFKILSFEYSSKFYKSIGVYRFKKILQKYPIPFSTRKIILVGKNISSIEDLNKQMKDAEEIHVFAFIINILVAILFGFLRDTRFFIWLTIFNIIMNLYPILVQRFNRNRIRIIVEKYYSKWNILSDTVIKRSLM